MISSLGEVSWSRFFSTNQWGYNWFESAALDFEGRLLIAGSTNGPDNVSLNGWCMGLDETGRIEWQKETGWDWWDSAVAFIPASARGEYILAGTRESPVGDSGWKVDWFVSRRWRPSASHHASVSW